MRYIDDETLIINFSSFKHSFEHEIEFFQNYIDFNNEKLAQRRAELDTLLNQDIAENQEYESFIRNIYSNDYIKLPSYFYHSTIVSLYSLLESNLYLICNKIQESIGLVIGLNDLAGSNLIQKFRKFLFLFADINFKSLDKEWLRITDFQKLRNMIVHQNSQIRDTGDLIEKSDEYKILQKFKGINIIKTHRIFYIENILCVAELLELINTFINRLLQQIESKEFKKFDVVSKSDDKFFGLPF